jgi:hypothetical protein
MNDNQEVILYFFRKLVYVLYLEIGAINHYIHPEIAAKAYLKTAFFQREKERQAASLYHLIEQETDPEKIVEPFRERTGLTLEDIRRAFTEGDWRNKFGGYTFGGPRWIRVSEAAVELQDLIKQGEWQQANDLLFEIKGLKTNQGFLINQFERTERRR